MHIIYTDRHRLHATDCVEFEGHPFETEELPTRADIILKALEAVRLGPIAEPLDYGLDPILAVHDSDFVAFLRSAYAENAARSGRDGPVFTTTFATRLVGCKPTGFAALKGYYAFGMGTPILEGTWSAAYWSAQCALTGARMLRAGAHCAYALCRPPGHHAAADLYGGLCYLNNAAVAARDLQADGRVAILDVDYHHGNGTQAIFYSDPTVLYCSLHADPVDDYPFYWGGADEVGAGLGLGANHNWPLAQRTDDATYLAALNEALAAIREFAPRYLVVSAGLDIVEGDVIGGFCISRAGLREIGQRIAALALPTLIVQEGGYALNRLGDDAVAFLQPFA